MNFVFLCAILIVYVYVNAMITKYLLQVALASSTAARTNLKVARSHPLIIPNDIRQISIACFTRLSVNPTKLSSWRFIISISVVFDPSEYYYLNHFKYTMHFNLQYKCNVRCKIRGFNKNMKMYRVFLWLT